MYEIVQVYTHQEQAMHRRTYTSYGPVCEVGLVVSHKAKGSKNRNKDGGRHAFLDCRAIFVDARTRAREHASTRAREHASTEWCLMSISRRWCNMSHVRQ